VPKKHSPAAISCQTDGIKCFFFGHTVFEVGFIPLPLIRNNLSAGKTSYRDHDRFLTANSLIFSIFYAPKYKNG
jgi:hypothetical protein